MRVWEWSVLWDEFMGCSIDRGRVGGVLVEL